MQKKSSIQSDPRRDITVTFLADILVRSVSCVIYTVSQKNDNDVLHYNFNAHQLIF